MDVRGRGESARDPNPENYNPKVYAQDVLSFMDALGISRAVFIGTSMGGIITMAIAGKRLRAIAGAVLNDVGPKLSMAGLNRIAGYVGKSTPITNWDDAAERIRDLNQVAFPDNTAEDWQRWARRAFVINADGRFMLNYDIKIALAFQGKPLKSTSLVGKLLFRRLAKNRPTLLIRGGISDLLGPEEVAYMRSVAPDMQYAEVPKIGHAPMLMEADACSAISKFLQQVA
jgi:pimeloyl-ACP methyl ester carboxylesterase